MRRRHVCALIPLLALGLSMSLAAQEPTGTAAQEPAGTPPRFTLRTSIKGSLLASRGPDDPVLFPERNVVASLWRVRFEPFLRAGETVTFAMAYEQRMRVDSTPAGAAPGGILPAEAEGPYRVRQLDWALADSSGLAWRHEIDRASVAWHLPSADITLGRQAIGWGRGVLFGAVDLFAPFSPTEADREWRRGVDAVRADVKLTSRVSLDTVGAFGPDLDRSAFATRVRGYAGNVDLEVVGGRRARDLFAGLTSSAAVGDAELHGEVALFRTPAASTGKGDLVAKAVAGGSYRLPIGPGVLFYAEYHYSGWGIARAEDFLRRLAEPAFQTRMLRGDTQILQRHAVGALASSELSPELALGGLWVHSPPDGSGVLAPNASISLGDKVSVLLSVYVPYGRVPEGQVLQSAYGASGVSGFLQLRIYN